MEERNEEKLAYSLPEVAKITGLSLSYLYRLSSEGKIPVSKIGSRALVLKSELEKFFRINIRRK
ncbi:helix-turn-helix domain-containing protein [Desulfobacterota bacterium AH_259_B03_O07]|nr:helix-turn-helix domain-containing protein [Desulfobacterota bacterium AH_259_B03_O07]